jgi:hypothetical protein
MPATSRRLGVPLIALFGVVIAIVALAAPASAEPYRNHPTISVKDENPTAGSKITVCITGFLPGKNVVFRLDHTNLASVVVKGDDRFCTTITLPAGVTGDETIVAKGVRDRTASVEIEIARREDRGGANVPETSASLPGQNAGVQVLGVSASVPKKVTGVSASVPNNLTGVSAIVPLQVAGVSASAAPAAVGSGLAFTGANVIGIGALAVLLVVGGAVMLFSSKRRKVNG